MPSFGDENMRGEFLLMLNSQNKNPGETNTDFKVHYNNNENIESTIATSVKHATFRNDLFNVIDGLNVIDVAATNQDTVFWGDIVAVTQDPTGLPDGSSIGVYFDVLLPIQINTIEFTSDQWLSTSTSKVFTVWADSGSGFVLIAQGVMNKPVEPPPWTATGLFPESFILNPGAVYAIMLESDSADLYLERNSTGNSLNFTSTRRIALGPGVPPTVSPPLIGPEFSVPTNAAAFFELVGRDPAVLSTRLIIPPGCYETTDEFLGAFESAAEAASNAPITLEFTTTPPPLVQPLTSITYDIPTIATAVFSSPTAGYEGDVFTHILGFQNNVETFEFLSGEHVIQTLNPVNLNWIGCVYVLSDTVGEKNAYGLAIGNDGHSPQSNVVAVCSLAGINKGEWVRWRPEDSSTNLIRYKKRFNNVVDIKLVTANGITHYLPDNSFFCMIMQCHYKLDRN